MHSSFKEIGKLILDSDDILITAHVSPDGDSVGSVVGLALALESLNKKIYMVMQDDIPDSYKFLLRGSKNIMFPRDIIKSPSLAIFLDCTDLQRAGESWVHEHLGNIPIINIDHHVSNQYYGTLNYVDPKAASTTEIIYRLLVEMGLNISNDVATALYTGIVTDTGSFRYESTTEETLLVAAQLLSRGIKLYEIRENLYENKPLESLRLLAIALQKLHVSKDGNVAWISLSKNIFQNDNVKQHHFENVVNYPISIEGVKIGLFFRELENGTIKVSLRCRMGYDVNKVASIFGGGGHKQAAGCTLVGPLKEVEAKVIEVVQKALGDY